MGCRARTSAEWQPRRTAAWELTWRPCARAPASSLCTASCSSPRPAHQPPSPAAYRCLLHPVGVFCRLHNSVRGAVLELWGCACMPARVAAVAVAGTTGSFSHLCCLQSSMVLLVMQAIEWTGGFTCTCVSSLIFGWHAPFLGCDCLSVLPSQAIQDITHPMLMCCMPVAGDCGRPAAGSVADEAQRTAGGGCGGAPCWVGRCWGPGGSQAEAAGSCAVADCPSRGACPPGSQGGFPLSASVSDSMALCQPSL